MHLQRHIGLVGSPTGDPFDRIVGTDQTRQSHGAAETGKDAQLGFRQTHLRLCRHHPIVRRQTHLETAAQGDAVDCGDAGKRQILDRREHLIGLQPPTSDFILGQREIFAELGDIRTDDEAGLGAGHQQTLDTLGFGQLGTRLPQFIDGPRIEFIDRVLLSIKAQLDQSFIELTQL